MTVSLHKYAPPVITPAVGGSTPGATIDGLPGYNPKYLGGFYPTPAYARVRQLINGEGAVEYFPEDYPDFRLPIHALTQAPELTPNEIDRAIEVRLRGQYEPEAPYAYLHAWFNSENTDPAPLPSAEIYYLPVTNAWDSGAETTDAFLDRGAFTFTADAGAFAAVGIAPSGADMSDPHNIRFGFLLRTARPVAVIESGLITALASDIYPGAGATFTVRYADGIIDYIIDGTTHLRTIAPRSAASKLWYGAASLYGVNSSIVGVSVSGLSGASARLPKMRVARNDAHSTLPALTGSGGWLPYAQATLPAMTMCGGTTLTGRGALRLPKMAVEASRLRGGAAALSLSALTLASSRPSYAALSLRSLHLTAGDKVHASCRATLPALTARASTGRPLHSGGLLGMPRVRGIGTGSAARRGGASLTLPALKGRSAYYASATLALKRPKVFGFADPANEAFISGAPFAQHSSAVERLLLVTMDSSGALTSVALAYITHDALMASSGALSGSFSTTSLINALMNSTVIGASLTPLLEDGAETWVLNTDTGATSMYEGFQFNSYGVVGGVAYGAKSDGLYRLEGDTDAGLPIRASVSFGKHDFSTTKLKRLEAAYIGASSAGKMFLKVKLSAGEEYVYATRRSGADLANQRIDVGRGLQATYYEFELFNNAGGDFELDTVEFIAAELSRRV